MLTESTEPFLFEGRSGQALCHSAPDLSGNSRPGVLDLSSLVEVDSLAGQTSSLAALAIGKVLAGEGMPIDVMGLSGLGGDDGVVTQLMVSAGLGSEMIGVDAGRVLAFVMKDQSCRDFANKKFIDDPMRQDLFLVEGKSTIAADFLSCPFPAPSGKSTGFADDEPLKRHLGCIGLLHSDLQQLSVRRQ
jgi:hypothetical protein